MIGVRPSFPHPKSPVWDKTDFGLESKCRVTSPLFREIQLKLDEGHGIYLVNDTKYFSMRRKFSRWKLVCKFIIKVAMLSAVSFPELSLLELLLLHILSLNSEPVLFLVNNWLTHSGRKFPYTSKLKKRKDISTVINPLRKKDGMEFWNALKGKIYAWNRKYTTFLVTRVFVTCIVSDV